MPCSSIQALKTHINIGIVIAKQHSLEHNDGLTPCISNQCIKNQIKKYWCKFTNITNYWKMGKHFNESKIAIYT
jgi:hypothetical protein